MRTKTIDPHVPAFVRLRADMPLMTPGEVARLFRVDPKTVTRWANQGRLPSLITPGGHHRFRKSDVLALLEVEEDE